MENKRFAAIQTDVMCQIPLRLLITKLRETINGVVHPGEDCSNNLSDVFDALADWESQLKLVEIELKELGGLE